MNSKSNKVLSFMKLIPNIDLSTDRSDISFAILYASDESDDNNSLFDGLQKSKHNDDRAYDIGGFIEKGSTMGFKFNIYYI